MQLLGRENFLKYKISQADRQPISYLNLTYLNLCVCVPVWRSQIVISVGFSTSFNLFNYFNSRLYRELNKENFKKGAHPKLLCLGSWHLTTTATTTN